MAGILFTSPGTYTNAADLPQVSTVHVTPIPGAHADWAANQLAPGTASSWSDLTGSETLRSQSNPLQWPAVGGTGVGRYLAFDGTNDRMDTPIVKSWVLLRVSGC
jgi:hypothetical protein